MTDWTLKPLSGGSAARKQRTVPELLVALPELLAMLGMFLEPELAKGLQSLCNVSAPSDVSLLVLVAFSMLTTCLPALHPCLTISPAPHHHSCGDWRCLRRSRRAT